MKLTAKLLIVPVIATIVVIVWSVSRHSASHSLVQSQPIPISASIDIPKPNKEPFAKASARAVSDPLADTMASLRAKMRQWHESLLADADDEDERARLLQEMLALITDGNVAEIVQSLSAEEMETPFGAGALHHWMQADPVNATNWAANRPATTDQQTLAIADDWITRQQGLQDCIAQLPDTEWKQSFLAGLGSEISGKDPHAAIQFAEQMTPGNAQENLLKSVACDWVETDPTSALDWAANVKDPALRDKLVASAVQAYALVDPAQAATWLVSEVKSHEMVDAAAVNITETWAAQDPAAAAQWVAMFPAGDTRDSAVNSVLVHWLQTDRSAALSWVQTLPEGTGILASLGPKSK